MYVLYQTWIHYVVLHYYIILCDCFICCVLCNSAEWKRVCKDCGAAEWKWKKLKIEMPYHILTKISKDALTLQHILTHIKDHIHWMENVCTNAFSFVLCCSGSWLLSSRQSDSLWWIGPDEDLHPVRHLSPAEAPGIRWPWAGGAAREPGTVLSSSSSTLFSGSSCTLLTCCTLSSGCPSRQSVLSLGGPRPAGLHHGSGAGGLDHSPDRPGHLGCITGYGLVHCQPEPGAESGLGRR